MCDIDTMKQNIMAMVAEKRGGVSFAELEDIPGFPGRRAMGNGRNVFFWFGMSDEAIVALKGLCDDGRVQIAKCSAWVYWCDGRVPAFPIAKQRVRDYKSPRWMPCVLNLAK